MLPDSLHIQRLRSIDYWRGPVGIAPLSGGITNHNYLVEDAGSTFVARLCEERPLLGIDRRNEVVCHKAAMACEIAPEVVHHEPGLLVTRFLAGKTLAPENVRNGPILDRIARVLRRLHDSWDVISGEMLYFCPFQAIRTYARTAASLQARLPREIDRLIDDSRRLSHRIPPFRPVLCHNDLLAANLIDDDDKIWLIDWEYSGIGHPLFDLASVCANANLNEEQEVRLLRAYRGEESRSELTTLRVLRAASALREAIWSIIQTVASDIDFDYHGYAEENLRVYYEARERLGD